MSQLIPLALFGWIPLSVILFATLPTRRAILASYLLGWMFLPIGEIDVPFVHLNKSTTIAFGALLGTFLFGTKGRRLRLHWADLPMLLWCSVPFVTSMSNQLGAYDGAAVSVTRAVVWGTPYLLGRKYFADLRSQRELARGLFLAGLVYVPLCLFEIRFSPQLHMHLYGDHQHSFLQTIRGFGLYRPMVFMEHGLMVGMFMAAASLVGVHLWRTGSVRHVWGLPMGLLVTVLVGTTVLCQSFGALLLLALGLVALFAKRGLRPLIVTTLVALPIVYLSVRVPDLWTGEALPELVAGIDADRAYSFQFRLEQEAILSKHALERPFFGWGGYGRAFPYGYRDGGPLISDSLWIVTLGMNGLVGLVSVIATLLLPILIWSRRCSPRSWSHSAAAPGAALAVVLAIYALDGMVNMMINPVFLIAAGSLTGFVERGTLVLRRHAVLRRLPSEPDEPVEADAPPDESPDGGVVPHHV